MIGKPCAARCVTVTWSLMIISSPWAKALGLLPGTATKPGSAPPLLMSKAKYLAVRAELALLAGWALRAVVAGVLGAAAATPIVPHAASAAPAAIIVALRAGLCIADLLDARVPASLSPDHGGGLRQIGASPDSASGDAMDHGPVIERQPAVSVAVSMMD